MIIGKYSRHSGQYIIAGSFLLIIYIIFLLAFYYSNNTALEASSLKRLQLHVENKAATLEYFFLERKYDIRTLTDSPEINTYFNNRNMGMSEQYGLKVSLFTIQRLMQKIIAEKTIGSKAIYKKIALINKNRELLVTTKTISPQSPLTHYSWESLLDTVTNEPELFIQENDSDQHEIVLIAPCLFKKQVAGWVVAWLQQATLNDQFISSTPSLSSKVLGLTLADGSILNDPESSHASFPWKKYQHLISTLNHPIPLHVKDLHAHEQNFLLTRVRIHPSPLYLTAYVKENEIVGGIKTWQFLLAAAVMILLILALLSWSIRANIRHLVLMTRFNESKKQRHNLTEKNRQLKEEIDKRKLAEIFLKENEERYRKLFEFSSDAILILRGTVIIGCNQKTAELLNLSRKIIPGRTFSSFSADEQQDVYDPQQEISTRIDLALLSPQNFEWLLQTSDGSLLHTEINMSAIRLKSETVIQVLVRDITERKRTQEILVQTEKMMAVGGLAAGMAHEINNPLGVILQAAQSIERRLGTDLEKNYTIAASLDLELANMQEYFCQRRVRFYLDSIQAAGERAARIVRTMLDFGRTSRTDGKEFCDINGILEDTLTIAGSDYDLKKTYDFKKIKVNRQYGKLGKVYCARTEIGQVFLNIIKNGAQAMAANRDTGKQQELTFKTRSNGSEVIIAIHDNGPGMDKKTQQSIFEPFFTTKSVGEGTGLGLSVSYFIITSHHNGHIMVSSEPGQGTTFTITLPVGNNAEKAI